jgi:opacity protein-like surface antigen
MTTTRKFSIAVGLVFLLAMLSAAQEVPKVETYFGYNYLRVAPPGNVNAFNTNGGLGALQYNFNQHVGIVGEFGGNTAGRITVGGIAGGRAFGGDQTQFSYLFGPRVSINKTGKYSPFFEYFVGGIHNSRSFSVANSQIPVGIVIPAGFTVEPGLTSTKFRSTQNAFAMAIGGGFDIKVNNRVAVRPIQLDYLPSHFSPLNFSTTIGNNTRWQNNLRYSAGISFRFGGGGAKQ